jgi:hypothetical protein
MDPARHLLEVPVAGGIADPGERRVGRIDRPIPGQLALFEEAVTNQDGQDEEGTVIAAGAGEELRQRALEDVFRGEEVRAHEEHGDLGGGERLCALLLPRGPPGGAGVIPELDESLLLEGTQVDFEAFEPLEVGGGVADEDPGAF